MSVRGSKQYLLPASMPARFAAVVQNTVFYSKGTLPNVTPLTVTVCHIARCVRLLPQPPRSTVLRAGPCPAPLPRASTRKGEPAA